MPGDILVGDQHGTLKDLHDCQKLADLILEKCLKHNAKAIWLGDLFHFHSIIHAEVMRFWYDVIKKFNENNIECIFIKGNHDQAANKDSNASSLLAYKELCTIVDDDEIVIGNLLFVPYQNNKEKFINICNQYPSIPTVICHQSFMGASYDNGFPMQDAIDPNLIQQKQIISGHIHSTQSFGKVFYAGSTRWISMNDANIDKYIWYTEFDEDGKMINVEKYDTGEVCKRIISLVDTEENPLDEASFNNKDDYRVEIKGSHLFIESRKPIFSKYKFRCTSTDKALPRVSESNGIMASFYKWTEEFAPKNNTDKETLKKKIGKYLEQHGIQ